MDFDGISMNIQEENSAHYFRVQSEREQTLVKGLDLERVHVILDLPGSNYEY